jgi:excisionase family DNA binding protein
MSSPSNKLEDALEDLVRRILRAELEAATRPTMITVAQAAERIAMSPKFIRAAIADGRLPSKSFGSAIRVWPADVDALGSSSTPRKARAADTPAARAAAKFRGGR